MIQHRRCSDLLCDFNFDDGDRLDFGGQAFTESQTPDGVLITFADGSDVFLEGATDFSDDWVI